MATQTTLVEVIGDVNVLSFKFKWEIDVFRMLSSCKNSGEFVQSPKFMPASGGSNDVQWYMKLFPRGDIQDAKDYLSIYLVSDKEIKAVSSIKILNNKGETIVKHTNIQDRNFGKGGWGFQKCVLRDFIMNPKNAILNGDKMKIVCEIIISAYKKEEVTVKSNEEVEYAPSHFKVIEKYEALLNDGKFSDVSLISEGKTLKVHKCILAKSSTVFAAMFEAEMRERQESTVEIADITYDVLVEMVRFVYAGKVNNIDALAGELAVAADKYALDELKDTCEKTMTKNLSADNVIGCLQLADKLRMNELKEKAVEFIIENLSNITDNPDFHLLSADILRKVCCGLAKKKK